jgi:hypothetical protein
MKCIYISFHVSSPKIVRLILIKFAIGICTKKLKFYFSVHWSSTESAWCKFISYIKNVIISRLLYKNFVCCKRTELWTRFSTVVWNIIHCGLYLMKWNGEIMYLLTVYMLPYCLPLSQKLIECDRNEWKQEMTVFLTSSVSDTSWNRRER